MVGLGRAVLAGVFSALLACGAQAATVVSGSYDDIDPGHQNILLFNIDPVQVGGTRTFVFKYTNRSLAEADLFSILTVMRFFGDGTGDHYGSTAMCFAIQSCTAEEANFPPAIVRMKISTSPGLVLATINNGPAYFNAGCTSRTCYRSAWNELSDATLMVYLDRGPGGAGKWSLSWFDTAVPEPATWAMMITGFGLAGAGLRRRRASSSRRATIGPFDVRRPAP